jgi:hypothetical protein
LRPHTCLPWHGCKVFCRSSESFDI